MNHVHFQERFDFVRTLLQDRYAVKVYVTVLFVTRQSLTLTLTGSECRAYRIRDKMAIRL
jgi:hypothetical protein